MKGSADFDGRFIRVSGTPFECPDRDCNPQGYEKVNLYAKCPACEGASAANSFHDFDGLKVSL